MIEHIIINLLLKYIFKLSRFNLNLILIMAEIILWFIQWGWLTREPLVKLGTNYLLVYYHYILLYITYLFNAMYLIFILLPLYRFIFRSVFIINFCNLNIKLL